MARRMLFGVLLSTVLALYAAAEHPQTGTGSTTEDWLKSQHRAVELYRSGDLAGSLRVFLERNLDEHRAIAETIRTSVQRPVPPKGQAWDARTFAALGALHMEAALYAYTGRDPRSPSDLEIPERIKLAERIFSFTSGALSIPNPAPRWILALGLIMFAGGEYRWAVMVLDDACGDFDRDVPLLVACGSLHETAAALPAHAQFRPDPQQLVTDFARRRGAPPTNRRLWTSPLEYGLPPPIRSIAEAAQRSQIALARRWLTRAVHLDPKNVEARIRLASLEQLAREDHAAASLLEELVAGKFESDARSDYLSRLFLGAIRWRGGHLEAAATLFEDASRKVPWGQSAWLAVAEVARARGDRAAAQAAIDRMLQAPRDREDPWWNYPFGQFWIPEPLLDALRAEVRR